MVQVGHALDVQRRWEDLSSLKRELQHKYATVREYIRRISQVAADAAADVEELSAETLTAMSASKALEVWQKTDQVGTDGGETGTVEWQDVLGNVTEATFTIDATATTTHAPLVAAVTTARAIRSFALDTLLAADEVLLGNVAGTEIFAVIKVGHYQCLKSLFKAATNRRAFLAKVDVELDVASAAVATVAITYTPKGHVSSTTKSIVLAAGDLSKSWEPCLELEPASVVSMTLEDNNAAHPTVIVTPHYIEAY